MDLGQFLEGLMEEKEYPPEIKSLILVEGNSFSVDWEKYIKFRRPGSRCLEDSAARLLIDLGVLSTSTKGNYGLIGRGMELNPRYDIGAAYFIQKEDAVKFKDVECSNAIYSNLVQYLD